MNTTERTGLVGIIIVLFVITSWCMNVYRLTQCDFKPSYKGEVVHAIGLFFPTFIMTAWIDFDSE